MGLPRIVSQDEWVTAQKSFVVQEKAATKQLPQGPKRILHPLPYYLNHRE